MLESWVLVRLRLTVVYIAEKPTALKDDCACAKFETNNARFRANVMNGSAK